MNSTSNSSTLIVLGLTTLSLVNLCLLLVCFSRLTKFQNRWRDFLRGGSGESLEDILLTHVAAREKFAAQLSEVDDRTDKLEKRMRKAKRHLGLTKFDAFPDVGGEQSFALALYDDDGNGALLTGLIGRTDSRIYCKPIKAGEAERQLTGEESAAIQAAAAPVTR